jgi:hypothetical protein
MGFPCIYTTIFLCYGIYYNSLESVKLQYQHLTQKYDPKHILWA